MSREYYLITKMSYPNVVGLVEISRRTGATIDQLHDVYGVHRLVKIDNTSALHEVCNRTLENRTIFSNYRLIIKLVIIDALNKNSPSKILKMEKHKCYTIIIREVITSVINKYIFRGRRAITRNENQLSHKILCEVLSRRSDRLKNKTIHLHNNFETDLMTTINETRYIISKNET